MSNSVQEKQSSIPFNGFRNFQNPFTILSKKISGFVKSIFLSFSEQASFSDVTLHNFGNTRLNESHTEERTQFILGKNYINEIERKDQSLTTESELCEQQMRAEKEHDPITLDSLKLIRENRLTIPANGKRDLGSPMTQKEYEDKYKDLEVKVQDSLANRREKGNAGSQKEKHARDLRDGGKVSEEEITKAEQESKKANDEYNAANKEYEEKGKEIRELVETHKKFEIVEESGNLSGLQYSISEATGRRKSKVEGHEGTEDAHFASEFTIRVGGHSHNFKALGVFDGHDHYETSRFLAENMAKKLQKNLSQDRDLNEELDRVKIVNAIRETFSKLNQELKESVPSSAHSGSTGLLALIHDEQEVYVANCGDSRAVLVKADGNVKQLSYDAKPNERRFTDHISEDKIVNGKIKLEGGGSIGVVRSFGDFNTNGVVLADPELTCTAIKPGDTLLLACDGFWDQVNSKGTKDVSKIKNVNEIPTLLVSTALDREPKSGSNDNITVIAARMQKNSQ